MRSRLSRWRPVALVVSFLVMVGAVLVYGYRPSPVGSVAGLPEAAPATIITNARVWTVDRDLPVAEAFAYDRDGVIVAVGSVSAVEQEVARLLDASDHDEAPRTIDMDGAFVIPGFHDIHVHVPEAGLNQSLCLFEPGLSMSQYGSTARDCAARRPNAGWVLGAGAPLFEFRTDLTDDGLLPIDVLDEAVPDRPALIIDDLGHAAWTNTLGLKAAGIGPDAPNPKGGIFHRDEATGRLSGLLLEDAQQVVRNAAAIGDEFVDEGLHLAMSELSANGVTSISDAGGYWGQRHYEAWVRAHEADLLDVRAANALYVYPDHPVDTQLDELVARFSADDDWLRFDTAKVYVDGILDLGTARMAEPYAFAPDPDYPNGFAYFGGELGPLVDDLHQVGFRINFHVIGDAAMTEALDVLEQIDAPLDEVVDRRHRATHAYVIDPVDFARIVDLGVVIDHQQGPVAVNPTYHESVAELIGAPAYDLIATGAVVDAGATVTLSSDWDAGPLSPLGTIMRSVTRPTNPVPDVETAIEMLTINSAYALGHDDRTGSIEVGKLADFVVLGADLLTLDPSAIANVDVLATVVGGRATHVGANAPFSAGQRPGTAVED